jgi:flagellar protein FlbD
MITVTRLSSGESTGASETLVNADLIELIEATPDTLITLTTGRRLLVRESPTEIVARILRYRRETLMSLPPIIAAASAAVAAGPTPPKEIADAPRAT